LATEIILMQIKKLIISIVAPLTIGAIAGIATSRNISTWYKTLNRPSFAPPNYLFGPVWTTLYIIMGTALYIFWVKSKDSDWQPKGFTIFGIQLALNFIWSFLFFEFKWMGVALFEIIILWIAIFLTILVFSRVSKLSAWLLVPYIAWVSFASILNFYYWDLNRIIE
jgi:translocator protein